jgi:hypothetical protein
VAGPNVATEERKANRVRLRSGRVGGVQRMHRGALGPGGYGFLIQDDDGKPKLALCYKTQEDADDAAAHADQMLAKTMFLIGMDGETHRP